MQFTTVSAILATLALVSASPLAAPAPQETADQCTTYMAKLPTRIGIVVGAIVTATSSVDCDGCVLAFTNPWHPAIAQITPAPEAKREANNPNLLTITTTETVCAISAY